MQVYTRIANPTMPQGTANQTNTPSYNVPPGEIGCAFNDQNTGRTHLRVKLDSGATSATPIGIVQVGQLAFWKDRTANIVTNDKRQADTGPSGAINRVAGVFLVAATAGGGVNGSDGLPLQYVTDLCIKGNSVSVWSDGTALVGAQATADTTASQARVVYTTGVNTAPVSQVVGVMRSSTVTNNLVPVDVSLGMAVSA